jgi:hypothetical protein
MKHLQKQRRRSQSRAFSLVEVVFALGLTAGTMTVLVALLPVSLTAFANSKQDTIRANIIQDVAGNANQSPYGAMNQFITNVWYYDDQGQQLQALGPTALYKASILPIPAASYYPLPPYTTVGPAPGGSGAPVDTNICVLNVEIDRVNGSPQPIPNSWTTNSIIVSNQGK